MHRVQDLADRRNGAPPAGASPFESLISLPGILAEVLGVKNAASKKVRQAYFRLLASLGPELEILRRAAPGRPGPGGGQSSWPTALTGCAGVRCTSMGATTALMGRFASLPRPSAAPCWARADTVHVSAFVRRGSPSNKLAAFNHGRGDLPLTGVLAVFPAGLKGISLWSFTVKERLRSGCGFPGFCHSWILPLILVLTLAGVSQGLGAEAAPPSRP